MTNEIYEIEDKQGVVHAIKDATARNAIKELESIVNKLPDELGEVNISYTMKGIESYSIKSIEDTYVTDDFKGTSATDQILSNCPALEEVYNLFYNKYLGTNSDGYSVSKKSLGKDSSGLYDLIEYDFCPKHWTRLILLSSGMNGYEVNAIFGLGYFIQEIMERHNDDEMLKYIYDNVRIKVIPFINPWGYSVSPKMYTNFNGVNINRNFDVDGIWAAYSPDSNPNNAKGTAPFSEVETKILRQWANDNAGTEFWIDCHTSLVTEDIDLDSSSLTTSSYYNKVKSAHAKLEAWIKDAYTLSTVTKNYRYDSIGAMKQKWFEKTYNKPIMVIEQASKNTHLGIAKNGDRAGIIHYESLIYAYVSEFLLKPNAIIDFSNYIESVLQKSIANTKRDSVDDNIDEEPDNPIVSDDPAIINTDTVVNLSKFNATALNDDYYTHSKGWAVNSNTSELYVDDTRTTRSIYQPIIELEAGNYTLEYDYTGWSDESVSWMKPVVLMYIVNADGTRKEYKQLNNELKSYTFDIAKGEKLRVGLMNNNGAITKPCPITLYSTIRLIKN